MSYFKDQYTTIKPNPGFHTRMVSLLHDYIFDLTSQQYKEESLIGESCALSRVQQVWLIYYTTLLIHLELTDSLTYCTSTGTYLTWSYFVSKYNIAEVIKSAKCLGLDYINDIVKEMFYYDSVTLELKLTDDQWILASGCWNDDGIWVEDAIWIEGTTC